MLNCEVTPVFMFLNMLIHFVASLYSFSFCEMNRTYISTSQFTHVDWGIRLYPFYIKSLLLLSSVSDSTCRSLAQAVRRRLLGFKPRTGHVGFVVYRVALGQVFSEYFSFPSQFSFHRLLHTRHLSSVAGTIGHLVAAVPSGLSLTPPQETNQR
jgi:hypothetical protein